MTDIEGSQSAEPFVKVPVALLAMVERRDLSERAAMLYILLLTHVNTKRGDYKVWPSRRKLARKMLFTVTRSVDRYIAELVDAKLILRDHRWRADDMISDTNMYTLLLIPSGGSAGENTTPPPAETSVSAAQGVVLSGTLRGSALANTGIVLPGAPELEEVELEEEVQDLSPREVGSVIQAAVPARVETRENDPPEPKTEPKHPRAVYEAMTTCGADQVETDVLVPAILGMLIKKPAGAGWWRTVAENGDLDRYVAAARREVAKASARVAAAAARPEAPPLKVSVPPPTIQEVLRTQAAARAAAKSARLAAEEEARQRREQLLKEVIR